MLLTAIAYWDDMVEKIGQVIIIGIEKKGNRGQRWR